MRAELIAAVEDAEGVTHEYVYVSDAKKPRDAESRSARSVTQSGRTLLGITPAVEHRGSAKHHRLLVVAASALAVSIAVAMVIGLTLGDGAL